MSKNVQHDSTSLNANLYRDGVTGNQKPIIVRHPHHPNLVIAGGGSYTHAKDIPYIGRIVTEVLRGTETYGEFGWEESSADKDLDNQPALYTDRVFADLELEAGKEPRVMSWKEGLSDWII